MSTVSFGNQLVFAAVTIATWVTLFAALEIFVFDGDLLTGVIRGVAGGVAFTLVYSLVRRSQS